MLGQGGAPFRLGPAERLRREPGPTYVVDPQGSTAWNSSGHRVCPYLPAPRGMSGKRF